jgi:hypothetical protein
MMRVGDRVKLKKCDDLTGVITDVVVNTGRHYLVIFDLFSIPIVCLDTDIEPLPIANPCVCCGAETPEGRQVCGMCERRQI